MSMDELLTFLQDPKPEVRELALNRFATEAKKEEGLSFFKAHPEALLLVSQRIHDSPLVAADAISTLVNVTRDATMVERLAAREEFLTEVLRIIINPEAMTADLACMLLANLTQNTDLCKRLIQVGDSKFEGLRISKLADIFSKGRQFNPKADMFHLALVFGNISRIERGRLALLSEERGAFLKLLPFLTHPKLIVRGGIATTIKNCCFQTTVHEWLISDQVKLVPLLLLPLAKPTDFREHERKEAPPELLGLSSEKKREGDVQIRKLLLEALLLLASSTREIREHLRQAQVYAVVRELHKEETLEDLDDVIDGLVNLLIRDESAEESGISIVT